MLLGLLNRLEVALGLAPVLSPAYRSVCTSEQNQYGSSLKMWVEVWRVWLG